MLTISKLSEEIAELSLEANHLKTAKEDAMRRIQIAERIGRLRTYKLVLEINSSEDYWRKIFLTLDALLTATRAHPLYKSPDLETRALFLSQSNYQQRIQQHQLAHNIISGNII